MNGCIIKTISSELHFWKCMDSRCELVNENLPIPEFESFENAENSGWTFEDEDCMQETYAYCPACNNRRIKQSKERKAS